MSKKSNTRFYIYTSLFAALTAIGAFIKIPVPPVPFTLQTIFVFLSGGLLGPVGGMISQSLYLITGLIGVPVFAYGGGPGYIYQPSFGFLASYPLAAFVIGLITNYIHKTPSGQRTVFLKYSAIYSAGTLIVFVIGLSYLAFQTYYIAGKEIDIYPLIWSGFIIFIPFAIVKIFISAYLTIKLKKTGLFNFENE
ncbi:MAG: biotin transporter BioY [bacterium]|nr:biotin transporter BioY [bacterium]